MLIHSLLNPTVGVLMSLLKIYMNMQIFSTVNMNKDARKNLSAANRQTIDIYEVILNRIQLTMLIRDTFSQTIHFKGKIHTKIIYSPSCWDKPISGYIFRGAQKKKIQRIMLFAKMSPMVFHGRGKFIQAGMT